MMYVRFPLSLRNVEDLLHERGIDICHESVRLWVDRFGSYVSHHIRKRRSEAMRLPSRQWARDVSLPALVNPPAVRSDPIVSVQSIQQCRAYQPENPIQTETRSRASRVARSSRRLVPARLRRTETVHSRRTPPKMTGRYTSAAR